MMECYVITSVMHDPTPSTRSGAPDGPAAAIAPAEVVHAHDHDHSHGHDRAHGTAHAHDHPGHEAMHETHRHGAASMAPAFSLIGVSLAGRLGIAAALSMAIWAAVAWALAPIAG